MTGWRTTVLRAALIMAPLSLFAPGADAAISVAMTRNAIAADQHGNVIRALGLASSKGSNGLPDSNVVVRGNRGTLKIDTLARLKSPPSTMSQQRNAKGEIIGVSIITPPLAVGDDVPLSPDGWAMVARLKPYHVEWISPMGAVTRGDALPWREVKVTDRERAAYFESRNLSVARGGQMTDAVRLQLAEADKLFSEAFPPFIRNGLLALGDGRVLVRHTPTADSPMANYDLVDRRGKLAGTLVLGTGESVVAITKANAYVVWNDNDDIERLRRHPWP